MRIVVSLVGLLLAASLVGCTSGSIEEGGSESVGEAESAMPARELYIEYFSNATYTTLVGARWIGCRGSGRWGRTSIYKITESGEECDSVSIGSGGDVGCYQGGGYCPPEYRSCTWC
ncbi:DUF6289 family protein [Sorangium sp. So ce315]|uniref:DUF6289 family protein n=1 Tax=Sorangium sp. So ce315 TaxID=3133299 RepID=UPI003F5ECEC4